MLRAFFRRCRSSLETFEIAAGTIGRAPICLIHRHIHRAVDRQNVCTNSSSHATIGRNGGVVKEHTPVCRSKTHSVRTSVA